MIGQLNFMEMVEYFNMTSPEIDMNKLDDES